MVTEVRNIGAMIDVQGLGIKGPSSGSALRTTTIGSCRSAAGWCACAATTPGDTMQVQIDEVDLHKKEADFRIVKTKQSKGKRSKTQRKTKRNFPPKYK